MNGLIVIEGFESIEQLDFVRGLGVDISQGYLLSRPYKIIQKRFEFLIL